VEQIFIYADDAKLFSFVTSLEDSVRLQNDIDCLTQLMQVWLLRLNIGKCKAVSYGRRPAICTNYNDSGVAIDKIESIKDLGVTFDNKLKFDHHINNIINKAYQILGIVKRNFTYHQTVLLSYIKSMIRSQLEYAVCVWNPHHQYLIEKLEKVQKRATKLVLSVKKLHYEDRLRQLGLQLLTLKYRRIRGDMIELYKIFAGIYDNDRDN